MGYPTEAEATIARMREALAQSEVREARLQKAAHDIEAWLRAAWQTFPADASEKLAGRATALRDALTESRPRAALDTLLADARREVVRGVIREVDHWRAQDRIAFTAIEAIYGAADRLAPGWRGEEKP